MEPMDVVELQAYLLKTKLRNLEILMNGERTTCPRLNDNITGVINILERICSSARNASHNRRTNEFPHSIITPDILDVIGTAEDVTDRFLAGRSCGRGITHPLFGYQSPCCTQKDLATGLKRFKQRTPFTFIRAALTNSPVHELNIPPTGRTSIERWESNYVDNVAQREVGVRLFLQLLGIPNHDDAGNNINGGGANADDVGDDAGNNINGGGANADDVGDDAGNNINAGGANVDDVGANADDVGDDAGNNINGGGANADDVGDDAGNNINGGGANADDVGANADDVGDDAGNNINGGGANADGAGADAGNNINGGGANADDVGDDAGNNINGGGANADDAGDDAGNNINGGGANADDVEGVDIEAQNEHLPFNWFRQIYMHARVDHGAVEMEARVPQVLALAVHAQTGSGKTTLVRAIYDDLIIRRHFHCRAWVSIHENLVLRDVIIELMGQVRETGAIIDYKKEESQLVSELYQLISSRGRYLIVLDDCRGDFWPRLQACFPGTPNGSRVIIITAAPAGPGFDADFPLGTLINDEPLRFLFNQLPESLDPGIRDLIDRELTPQALVLLNGALRTRPDLDIRFQMREIRDYWGWSQSSRSPEEILEWSYHDLHPRLKTCFIYLGIFPKAVEVPVRRVWRLWISEGFLDYQANGENVSEPLEDLANMFFTILVNRKLIEVVKWRLDGSPKTCRIPIFAHDFALGILQDTNLFHVFRASDQHQPARVEGRNVRRVACHPNCSVPANSLHGRLRSYVTFHTKIGGQINEEISLQLRTLMRRSRFTLLKVLDLEGVYRPRLSNSIGRLLFLRFLGLRSTLLDFVPRSIGKLPCLETLDLKHTNVTTLPSSIFKSKKIRHLYVKELPLQAFIPKPCRSHCQNWKPSLTLNLETLTGLYIDGGVDVTNIQLGSMRKLGVTCRGGSQPAISTAVQLISKMTTLRSLKLRSTRASDRASDQYQLQQLDLSLHGDLKKLYLQFRLERDDEPVERPEQPARPECPVPRLLPPNLRELTLSMSSLREDPMPVLSGLGCLVVLRLLARSYVGEEMRCGYFPRLRVLKLWKLPNLRRLTVEEQGMPELREMEIRECPNMLELRGRHVTSLTELVLTDMPEEFAQQVRDGYAEMLPILYIRKTTKA